MSKKPATTEFRLDKQINNEGSDGVLQYDDDVKRVKVTSLSNIMLEDLPLELIHCIFVRAIATEVDEMHLVKSVWKEKADLVISRLGTVCRNWNDILITDLFRNGLFRTLDRTVEKRFRLELLHQFPVHCGGDVFEAITFKDEVFVLCQLKVDVAALYVYDRYNSAEHKNIIRLPKILPLAMAACGVSNCIYVLSRKIDDRVSIVRITKKGERRFKFSPWISCNWKARDLYVTADGSIVLLEKEKLEKPSKITVLDAQGSLQHEISLSDRFDPYKVIPKSNGKFVVKPMERSCRKLREIDLNGTVLREFVSTRDAPDPIAPPDLHGRMLLVKELNEIVLLDDEFNRLHVTPSQLNVDLYRVFSFWHYDRDRNEFAAVLEHKNYRRDVFIFRLVEE